MNRILPFFLLFQIGLFHLSLGQKQHPTKSQEYSTLSDTLFLKKTQIPNLVGLTYLNTKELLQKRNIAIGGVILSSENNLDSQIVYRQNPSHLNKKGKPNFAKKNQLIDIWLFKSNTYSDTSAKKNLVRVAIKRDKT
mgnify:CR=1 FL=1